MPMPSISLRLLVLATVATPAFLACSAAEPPAPVCEERTKTNGECPGARQQSVALSVCTTTIEIGAPEALAPAAAAAKPGTCLSLGKGSFPAVDLPAGVHLVGKGEGGTQVAGATVHGGGTVVAALALTGVVSGAGGSGSVTLQQVKSTGATRLTTLPSGIQWPEPAISVVGLDLIVLDSTIEKSAGYGLAVACAAPCTVLPKVEVRRTLIDGNAMLGLWLHSVEATVDHVEIRGTKPKDFLFGRGIDLADRAKLTGTHFSIIDSTEAAILVDSSTVTLDDFVLARNGRGLQIQKATGSTVSNFLIKDNGAVGLLVDCSNGIIVQGGEVSGTKSQRVPVEFGGQADVGDGMNWRGNSEVKLSGTKFSNSGRQAIIVQGKNAGTLEAKLEGSDATTGIIVQGLDATGEFGIIVQGLAPKIQSKGSELPLATLVGMAAKK